MLRRHAYAIMLITLMPLPYATPAAALPFAAAATPAAMLAFRYLPLILLP
jgi:hypothetical protein